LTAKREFDRYGNDRQPNGHRRGAVGSQVGTDGRGRVVVGELLWVFKFLSEWALRRELDDRSYSEMIDGREPATRC
jgi:hypothetical protein